METSRTEAIVRMLEVIASEGGFHSELPHVDGLSRSDALDLTEALIRRGWVQAICNRGDDQLLSVRDVRIMPGGEIALEKAMKNRQTTRGSRMSTPLEQKLADRLEYMSALYDYTDGSTMCDVDMYTLGQSLGWDQPRTDSSFEYLEAEGLLEATALGGATGITHDGVVEVEASRRQPESPTEHFPAQNTVNNISINTMVGSQISQGSASSVQTSEIVQGAKLEDVADLVRQLRDELLPALDVSEDDRADFQAELATAEHQLQSDRPKSLYLRSALGQICELLKGAAIVAGSIVTLEPYLLRLHEILPLL